MPESMQLLIGNRSRKRSRDIKSMIRVKTMSKNSGRRKVTRKKKIT